MNLEPIHRPGNEAVLPDRGLGLVAVHRTTNDDNHTPLAQETHAT